MPEKLAEHIIVMQFPIVFIVALFSWQAADTFQAKVFRFLSLGWIFNLLYLFAHNYSYSPVPLLPETGHLLGSLERPLVFVSSMLFWYGARSFGPLQNVLLLRRLPDTLFFLFSISLLLWIELTGYLLKASPYLYLLSIIPDIFVDVCALSLLGLFFRKFAEVQSLTGHRPSSLLAYGAYLYACIQPLYLFTLPEYFSPPVQSISNTLGFLLGLMAKVAILFGFIGIFTLAATSAKEKESRTHETRRTVERIVHELGTPIGEMLVHVRILFSEAAKRGKYHRSLHDLEQALHRIQATMMAAKDLHKLRDIIREATRHFRTRQDEKIIVENINNMVQTAVMAIKETRDEDVAFFIKYSGNCCVRCRPSEIIRVVINLLRNSCDAFPNAKGKIILRTRKIDEDGEDTKELVEVSILDDGEGISKLVSERMFNEGFTTRVGPGRGFGLYIVQNLVRANKGTISISNREDPNRSGIHGCEARLHFPRVPCP